MGPMSVALQLQILTAKKRPVARLVLALLIISSVLIATLAGWEIWSARADQLRDAGVGTANIARILASHAEAVINVADIVLDDVVELVERSGSGPLDRQRLREHLERTAAKANELHGLFVYDEHGNWLATSLGRVVNSNNSDREYFTYHRTHTDQRIHIGTPVRSRSTGVWIIPVSRRLTHPDGSFAGVALATVRVDFFERLYAQLDVGKSGTILFARDDGRLYYRKPFNENYVGMDIASGPLVSFYRANGPVGTAMLTAKIDGVKRLYSYRHLANFPLIVAAALSEEEIYTDWQTSMLELVGGLLFFISMLVWLGNRLLRQLAIRERLEQQLHMAGEDLAQANMELSALALKDGLTQLANRRAFDAALAREHARARRKDTPLSLIILDVDWFKKFNDTYGHQAGDECLQKIAVILAENVTRQTDLAARYGGEEFVILLPDTDLEGAMVVAERIRGAVHGLGIAHAPGTEGRVTISAGIASFVPRLAPGAPPAELIRDADTVLYESKQRGRNRVCAQQSVPDKVAD